MKTRIIRRPTDSYYLNDCGYDTIYEVHKLTRIRRKYWLWGPEIEVWTYVDWHLSLSAAQKIAEKVSKVRKANNTPCEVVWESEQ